MPGQRKKHKLTVGASGKESDDHVEPIYEDLRISRVLHALLHKQSDAETIFQIATDTEAESKQGYAPLPFEVILRAVREVSRLRAAHLRPEEKATVLSHPMAVPLQQAGVQPTATGAEPLGSAGRTTADAEARAGTKGGRRGSRTELEKREADRRSLTLGPQRPPEELLSDLLQTALRHTGAWSDAERLVLQVQAHIARLSDERPGPDAWQRLQSVASDVHRCAQEAVHRFPDNSLIPWVQCSALRLYLRLFQWKHQPSDFNSCLEHLQGVLQAHCPASEVRGLLFMLAQHVQGILSVPITLEQAASLRVCMARCRDALVQAYLDLDERRLLDRIGVCSLLARTQKDQSEDISYAFSWETLQLSVRYIGEAVNDIDIATFTQTVQSKRRTLTKPWPQILNAARRLREQIPGARAAAATGFRHPGLEAGLAELLHWHVSRVGEAGERRIERILHRCFCDDEELLALPQDLLRLANAGDTAQLTLALQALPTSQSLEERITICLVQAIAFGNACQVEQRRAALDAAVALLPTASDRRNCLLRWSVLYQRGRARRQLQDLIGALDDFRQAGRSAVLAFAAPRVAQIMLAQQRMFEAAGAESREIRCASVVRLLCGLGLIAGHVQSVVHCAVGHFPPWPYGNKLQIPLLREVDQANERLFEQQLDDRTRDKYVGQIRAASLPLLGWASAATGDPRALADRLLKELGALSRQVGKVMPLEALLSACGPRSGQDAPRGRPFTLQQDALQRWTESSEKLSAALYPNAQILLCLLDMTLMELSRSSESTHAALQALLQKQLALLQNLAPATPSAPWWQGTQLQTRALELVARAQRRLPTGESRSYRRSQFEQRLTVLQSLQGTDLEQGHRRRWLLDVASLLEDQTSPPEQVYHWLASIKTPDLAAELDGAPVEDTLSDIEDGELTALTAPHASLAQPVASESPPAETQRPGSQTGAGMTVEHSGNELGASEDADSSTGCTLALEYMMAPSAKQGPAWDALCLVSKVKETAKGIEVLPLHTFYLGRSSTTRQRGLEKRCQSARQAIGRAAQKFFIDGVQPDDVSPQDGADPRKLVSELVFGTLGETLFPDHLVTWLRARQPAHVYLCPHQWLFHIPLHALPTALHTPLIDEAFTVSYLPTLRALAKPGFRSALPARYQPLPLFADPSREVLAQLEGVGYPRSAWSSFGSSSELLSRLRQARGAAFVCHGLHDSRAGMSWRSRLLLPHGVRLTAQLVAQSQDSFRGAEVLMLACQAGAARVEWGNNLGLLDAMVAGGNGVRSVVAPLYSIHTAHVGTFASTYQQARSDGKRPPLAYREAVHAVRDAAVKKRATQSADEFAVWMEHCAFVLYGPA